MAMRKRDDEVFPNAAGIDIGAGEHTRLARAADIDRACALASASWSAFQVMGFHWQRLGYASVEAFANLMRVSEAQHLDAFVRFIETDDALLKALRSRKWSTFASLYNGPAYKDNLYDTRLARAYDKYVGEVMRERLSTTPTEVRNTSVLLQ